MSKRSSGRFSNAHAHGVGPVGDPFHFFQVFCIVLAEEERINQRAHALPTFRWRLMICDIGRCLHEIERSPAREPAMLIAAFVGLTFDVQNDPAGLRIAIGRAIALHGGWIGFIAAGTGRIGCLRRCQRQKESRKTQRDKRFGMHGLFSNHQ